MWNLIYTEQPTLIWLTAISSLLPFIVGFIGLFAVGFA